MNIIIEGWNEPCPIGINEFQQFTIKIADKDVHFQMQDWWSEARTVDSMWEKDTTSYKIVAHSIAKLTVKTKEQIAAEESVVKAKEALKAAENALKVLTSQEDQK